MRRRALASVLAAAAVAAASVVAAVPSSQAAPALKYVALGDSYSAASGVLPVDPNAPVNCLRSTRNYPKVIAGTIGANLKDVTCGAAETSTTSRRSTRTCRRSSTRSARTPSWSR